MFDDARFDQAQGGAFYSIESSEAIWNTGRIEEKGNTAYKIRNKEGYFPAAPFDTQMDLRTEMVRTMEQAGIKIETHHHEVATAGQAEIDMERDTLLVMADKLIRYKYIVRTWHALQEK